MRMNASQAGKLNVKVTMSRGQHTTSQTASTSNDVTSVRLSGNSGQSSGAITFSSEARIVNTGGMCSYTLRQHLTILMKELPLS